MRPAFLCPLVVVFVSIVNGLGLPAQEFVVQEFRTQPLSDVYYSEGANAGDLAGVADLFSDGRISK